VTENVAVYEDQHVRVQLASPEAKLPQIKGSGKAFSGIGSICGSRVISLMTVPLYVGANALWAYAVKSQFSPCEQTIHDEFMRARDISDFPPWLGRVSWKVFRCCS
jgi:hypothetical protein